MKLLTAILILSALLVCSISYAGVVHNDLRDIIDSSSADEMIEVSILLSGGISAEQLNSQIGIFKKNSSRHRKGILLLQRTARLTQADLLQTLRDLEQKNLAANIRSYWIINAVSVKLAVSEIMPIALRADIIKITPVPEILQIEPILPVCQPNSREKSDGLQDNLIYIGADSAWKLGYTGKGRIVGNFDSHGVDGFHPALFSGWKGHDGDSSAAWYNPYDNSKFPYTIGYHGTHTTGIMVGHDDITGDTIGVAPDARWIAATTASLKSFEWAADPDGDPNTSADVPDVINHSWGNKVPCWDYYWEVIDITEALGIINIFAAGNDGANGTNPMSILSPADRARDSLDNFAVGAIHPPAGLATHFSARGPSSCDSMSIKPNIMAPGGAVRSSVPCGYFNESCYYYIGGTSMSAPHVAGAAAILRQYAPDATPAEIKEALLAGAVPVDMPSPNNTYGWGTLYIPASLEFLADRFAPDLRVASFDYDVAEPGETVRAEIKLVNYGYTVDSIYVKINGDFPGLTIMTDSIHFGSFDLLDTLTGHLRLTAVFDDTLFPGTMIPVDLNIFSGSRYLKSRTVTVQAGIPPAKTYFRHTSDIMLFTVSNYGQFGFGHRSIIVADTFGGFKYPDTSWTMPNNLYEAALVIGTDQNHVCDGAGNVSLKPDDDFRIGIGGELEIIVPGEYADFETASFYDDGFAENRIGLQVYQKTLSWKEQPDNNYIILEFEIENVNDTLIRDIYAGLYFDWMRSSHNDDRYCRGTYSGPENLGYICFVHPFSEDTSWFRGLTVINHEGVASFKTMVDSIWRTSGLSDSAKFEAISGGIVDTVVFADKYNSLSQFISTGPFNLMPGERDTALFAVLASNYLDELRMTALRARNMYYTATGVSDIPIYGTPDDFYLGQNYPNPFNPSTIIEYKLPAPSKVTISVYNLLGQKVRTILDTEKDEGVYFAFWDGTDTDGHPAASGIYFYRIKAGSFENSKKMLLLR